MEPIISAYRLGGLSTSGNGSTELQQMMKFFGSPTQNMNNPPQTPGTGYYRGAPTLQEYWTGRTDYWANNFIISLLVSREIEAIHRVVPIVLHNGALTSAIGYYEFPAVIVPEVPENSPARLVEWVWQDGYQTVTRRGLGIQGNHAHLATPDGNKFLVTQLQQVDASFKQTIAFDTIFALSRIQNSWIRKGVEKGVPSPAVKAKMLHDQMQREVRDWNCLLKNATAWSTLVGNIDADMRLCPTAPKLTTFILPRELVTRVKLLQADETQAWLYGGDVQSNINDAITPPTKDKHGNEIIPVDDVVGSVSGSGALDRRVSIGEYAMVLHDTVDPERYSVRQSSVTVYDDIDDSLRTLEWDWMLDNCGRFNSATGNLICIGHLNAVNFENTDQRKLAQDFLHRFNALTGKAEPLAVMGQRRDLTPQHYSKTAIACCTFASKNMSGLDVGTCNNAINTIHEALRIMDSVSDFKFLNLWWSYLRFANASPATLNTGINKGTPFVVATGGLDFKAYRYPPGFAVPPGSEEEVQLHGAISGKFALPPTHGSYEGLKKIQEIWERRNSLPDANQPFAFDLNWFERVANAVSVFDRMVDAGMAFFPGSFLTQPRYTDNSNLQPTPHSTAFQALTLKSPTRRLFLSMDHQDSVVRPNYAVYDDALKQLLDFASLRLGNFTGANTFVPAARLPADLVGSAESFVRMFVAPVSDQARKGIFIVGTFFCLLDVSNPETFNQSAGVFFDAFDAVFTFDVATMSDNLENPEKIKEFIGYLEQDRIDGKIIFNEGVDAQSLNNIANHTTSRIGAAASDEDLRSSYDLRGDDVAEGQSMAGLYRLSSATIGKNAIRMWVEHYTRFQTQRIYAKPASVYDFKHPMTLKEAKIARRCITNPSGSAADIPKVGTIFEVYGDLSQPRNNRLIEELLLIQMIKFSEISPSFVNEQRRSDDARDFQNKARKEAPDYSKELRPWQATKKPALVTRSDPIVVLSDNLVAADIVDDTLQRNFVRLVAHLGRQPLNFFWAALLFFAPITRQLFTGMSVHNLPPPINMYVIRPHLEYDVTSIIKIAPGVARVLLGHFLSEMWNDAHTQTFGMAFYAETGIQIINVQGVYNMVAPKVKGYVSGGGLEPIDPSVYDPQRRVYGASNAGAMFTLGPMGHLPGNCFSILGSPMVATTDGIAEFRDIETQGYVAPFTDWLIRYYNLTGPYGENYNRHSYLVDTRPGILTSPNFICYRGCHQRVGPTGEKILVEGLGHWKSPFFGDGAADKRFGRVTAHYPTISIK